MISINDNCSNTTNQYGPFNIISHQEVVQCAFYSDQQE